MPSILKWIRPVINRGMGKRSNNKGGKREWIYPILSHKEYYHEPLFVF